MKEHTPNGASDERHLPELVQIAVILFPGFLTLRVSEYFAFSPKLDGVELIASALAATLLDIGVALVLVRVVPPLRRTRSAAGGGPAVTQGFVVLVAGVAIAMGMLWAVIESRGLLFRLRLSERVSRSEVWDTAFARNSREELPRYVRVVTVRGEVYHGRPALYSESTEERALLLEEARREVPVANQPSDPGHNPKEWQAVECVPVGSDTGSGAVLLLKDQVRLVEFRGHARKTVVPGKGTAVTYECAMWVPTPKPVEKTSE